MCTGVFNNSLVAEMGDHLANSHNRHGPKMGEGTAVLGGELDPHLTQCLPSDPTKWHLDPSNRLATTDMGLKLRVGL